VRGQGRLTYDAPLHRRGGAGARRRGAPSARAGVVLFAVLALLALGLGPRLGGWHESFFPRTLAPVTPGANPAPTPETHSTGAPRTYRWARLKAPIAHVLAGPELLGRPGSIHMTFSRQWQPLIFEVGGTGSAKGPVRVMCDACPGMRWLLNRPDDYSLEEVLLVDAATLGVLQMVGGSENVLEFNF
jgi:hypothetical protein